METTDIKLLPLLLLFLAIALVACLVPLEPVSVGVMTPFHRTFQGFYGGEPMP